VVLYASISQSKLPYTGMVLRDDFLHDKACHNRYPDILLRPRLKHPLLGPPERIISDYYLVPGLLDPRFFYVAVKTSLNYSSRNICNVIWTHHPRFV
jgi:hypothetical protein